MLRCRECLLCGRGAHSSLVYGAAADARKGLVCPATDTEGRATSEVHQMQTRAPSNNALSAVKQISAALDTKISSLVASQAHAHAARAAAAAAATDSDDDWD